MTEYTDLLRLIEVETEQCVNERKNKGNIFDWLKSRKAYKPGCELQIRQKYSADLNRLQGQNYAIETATNQAFFDKITGTGNNTMYFIIACVVGMFLVIYIWD